MHRRVRNLHGQNTSWILGIVSVDNESARRIANAHHPGICQISDNRPRAAKLACGPGHKLTVGTDFTLVQLKDRCSNAPAVVTTHVQCARFNLPLIDAYVRHVALKCLILNADHEAAVRCQQP